MCGIAGFLLQDRERPGRDWPAVATAMADRLSHRGPDAAGHWGDAAAGIHLVHRRLSIVDLSPAGAQPMASSCGRFVVSYNGEVYNAVELRRELEAAGRRFRGHSDTEAMVEGCAVWGVRATIERLIGMFAIAIWDRERQELHLVRDRLGIKPLYWGRSEGDFLFASELKALAAFPGWRAEIDPRAVGAYLRYGTVPAPQAIYRGMEKLRPGFMVTLRRDAEPKLAAYWTLADAVARARARPYFATLADSKAAVAAMIDDAVGRRMMADVPLGAFLSGGIDSSLVVATMQKLASRPVRTYSIGFTQAAYNEAPHAAEIARHLGTDHTELTMEESALIGIVPQVPGLYDEPFSDSSAIPTAALSRLTRDNVTVALSGDGGDELFGGYNRYLWAGRMERFWVLPGAVRRMLAGAAKLIPEATYDGLTGPIQKALGLQAAGHRVHKFADGFAANDAEAYYEMQTTFWRDLQPAGLSAADIARPPGLDTVPDLLDRAEERMQYCDMLTYMVDDILTKVDRASMAVALEVRVPLIDHRLVELSWQVPFAHKVMAGKTKAVLREILADHVPRALFERPKMGFGIPLDQWLRGPLRDWCGSLVADTDWTGELGLDGAAVGAYWKDFLNQGRASAYRLWVLLALAGWLNDTKGRGA